MCVVDNFSKNPSEYQMQWAGYVIAKHFLNLHVKQKLRIRKVLQKFPEVAFIVNSAFSRQSTIFLRIKFFNGKCLIYLILILYACKPTLMYHYHHYLLNSCLWNFNNCWPICKFVVSGSLFFYSCMANFSDWGFNIDCRWNWGGGWIQQSYQHTLVGYVLVSQVKTSPVSPDSVK